ncbi:hypothetical protein ABIA33_005120 [Streptacidiphilus sp. MAP12-16]|uniref:hypothetical protein n=1 Tax=Streptacidiphilus sp. MAP12-16 TaxID=3156300 RepID=UPI00351481BE
MAVPTLALPTLDGRWTDPWNASPLGDLCPEEAGAEANWRLSDAYLRGLTKDALIVQLLCHC